VPASLPGVQVNVLRSKLLRAEVTDAKLHYEGSLAIDIELMKLVRMLPYERILVGNISNGERFETYAIPAPAGSRIISLNGGTAHLGNPGDLLTIMTFTWLPEGEAMTVDPRVVVLGERNNRILKSNNLAPEAAPLIAGFKLDGERLPTGG